MIASSPSAPLPRFLRPDEIEIRPELQPRVALLTGMVEEYRDAYRADPGHPNSGTALPPLQVVVTPQGEHLLWDGFHRHAAGTAAGIETFPVVAVYGDFELALRRSLGANDTHGIRRTQEDMLRAVLKALDYFPEMSNRGIAEICHVTHTMVNSYRPVGCSHGNVGARGILLASNPDLTAVKAAARAIRTEGQARIGRAPQRAEEPEPMPTPRRAVPGERRAGLERMATALEHFLDCGRDLAEGHPDKLLLLILFQQMEEEGDKAILTLGGGE